MKSTYSDDQISTLCFEDLHAGDCFNLGSFTLSAEEIIRFASQYDPQPFHLSDEGARANPLFERMSASGWHTGLLLQGKLSELWQRTRLNPLAGAGIDEIRWVVPTYPDEVLHACLIIEEVAPSKSRPNMGRIKMKATLHKDGDILALLLRITGIFEVEPKPLTPGP